MVEAESIGLVSQRTWRFSVKKVAVGSFRANLCSEIGVATPTRLVALLAYMNLLIVDSAGKISFIDPIKTPLNIEWHRNARTVGLSIDRCGLQKS